MYWLWNLNPNLLVYFRSNFHLIPHYFIILLHFFNFNFNFNFNLLDFLTILQKAREDSYCFRNNSFLIQLFIFKYFILLHQFRQINLLDYSLFIINSNSYFNLFNLIFNYISSNEHCSSQPLLFKHPFIWRANLKEELQYFFSYYYTCNYYNRYFNFILI